jgi:hypothetical protein
MVDGVGGDVVDKGVKLLKPGVVIVQPVMAASPRTDGTMSADFLNAKLEGTTVGFRRSSRAWSISRSEGHPIIYQKIG